jgi:hypothetical protein
MTEMEIETAIIVVPFPANLSVCVCVSLCYRVMHTVFSLPSKIISRLIFCAISFLPLNIPPFFISVSLV